MAHPYKVEADSTGKSKMSNMGGKSKSSGMLPNSDLNNQKKVQGSTSTSQHEDQAAAPGYKSGGRLDRAKRGKSKKKMPMPPIAPPDMSQVPPSPADAMAAQAGAGSPPSPVPAPPMMQKRGGAVKKADGGEVSATLPNPFDGVKPIRAPKPIKKPASVPPNEFKRGGAVGYPLKKGGADSGVGRLEKSKGYK